MPLLEAKQANMVGSASHTNSDNWVTKPKFDTARLLTRAATREWAKYHDDEYVDQRE
jgi:hypothetical protein